MTRLVTILFLIVSLSILCQLPAIPQTQPYENLEAAHKQLNQLDSQRKYVEAIPVAEKILSLTEKMFGLNHKETAAALNNLALLYRQTGQYAEAEPLYKRSLAIQEKKLGRDDLSVASSLMGLARIYYEIGCYNEGIPLCKRALVIMEKKLGRGNPATADVLFSIAFLYHKTGRFKEAEPLYKKALQIQEKKGEGNDPQLALTLNNLAEIYLRFGRYEEAEPMLRRALMIDETYLDKDNPEIAAVLQNLIALFQLTNNYPIDFSQIVQRFQEIEEARLLKKESEGDLKTMMSRTEKLLSKGKYTEATTIAEKMLQISKNEYGYYNEYTAAAMYNLAHVYSKRGLYSKAEPLFQQSLKIMEKLKGKHNPHLVQPLLGLATFYMETGRYAEAEMNLRRALDISESQGKNHPDVAKTCHGLGALYLPKGHYTKAEKLLERALKIDEMNYGLDDPNIITSLFNLAMLYLKTGDYARAESLIKRSEKIVKKLGEDHPLVANLLSYQAALFLATGRYAETEPLYERSLEIKETMYGDDNLEFADALNDIATIYVITGRYTEAETLMNRALKISKTKLGENNPNVADNMEDLATLYIITNRYEEAEDLLKRVLEISEANLSKNHPQVAKALSSLAKLYYFTGRYDESELLYKRSLKISEKATQDKDHNLTAIVLNDLAALYATRQKYDLSSQYYLRGISEKEKIREFTFPLLSESEKLSYLAKNNWLMQAFLGIVSQHLKGSRKDVEGALNAWIRWKGAATESQRWVMEVCSRSEESKISRKCDELAYVRRITFSRPEKMDSETYQKSIAKYERRKDELEAELSRLSTDFRLEKRLREVNVKRIASLLPKDAAYLDFAVVRRFDFKEKIFEEKPRYLVFVLIPTDPLNVTLVDLGDSEAIDQCVQSYHEVIQDAVQWKRSPNRKSLMTPLKDIYSLIFLEPLLELIKDKKQIFISPDGSLNLIPFEAFLTSEDKYLIEKDISIHYVATGRDILRFKEKAVALGDSLILSDPDYDLEETERIEVARRLGVYGAGLQGRDFQSGGAPKIPFFEGINASARQAEEIKRVIKNAECRVGKEAIQEVLFATKSPRILHITTHGYFQPDQNITLQSRSIKDAFIPYSKDQFKIENPMLRSWIALAGANTSLRQNEDYGIVSAEKIMGLKLKGTEVVTLSACQTGFGEVLTGEGVFGLKRAFILSGAKTLIMSLWNVPIEDTTKLIESFYAKWATGKKTKSDALREAKRELMKKNNNPFFWAGFVMIGDPGK